MTFSFWERFCIRKDKREWGRWTTPMFSEALLQILLWTHFLWLQSYSAKICIMTVVAFYQNLYDSGLSPCRRITINSTIRGCLPCFFKNSSIFIVFLRIRADLLNRTLALTASAITPAGSAHTCFLFRHPHFLHILLWHTPLLQMICMCQVTSNELYTYYYSPLL